VAGLALIAAALAILAQLGLVTPYWILAAGLLVLGAGMGAAMTPATSAITSALPSRQQGVASAMNDLSREVGGALGIAVIGSIMTAIYRGHLTVTGVPAAVLGRARDSLAVASRIGGPVSAQASIAFIDGIHIALLIAAGTAVLAALAVAALLPRRPIISGTGRNADSHDEQDAEMPACRPPGPGNARTAPPGVLTA
jgi:MFS family permease